LFSDRPQLTANLTAIYNIGAFGIRLQQRYYDSTLVDFRWVSGVDIDNNEIDSQSLTNLGLTYTRQTDRGIQWQAAFTITNLFDREPPIIVGATGQVAGTSFDLFGRRFQLAVNMNF
jgi:outer membrane receptor protein involved in Fe transport